MVEATNTVVKFTEGEYRLSTEPIPTPGAGEALVRIHYTTVNPIDRHYFYGVKTEGQILGTDGCGVIEQVGEGVSADLVGKKVSLSGKTYAQYKVAELKSLIVLHDSQDLRQAANAIVNPLTAVAELEIARNKKSKAVVNLVAASQLGKQLYKLMTPQGIDVLNVVRREEQV